MYPRREGNSNMNRSYANALNGDAAQAQAAQDAEKKFYISNKCSGQQNNFLNLNGNQKMDFSIFHGQNSNLQRKPIQINSIQDRSNQQPNQLQRDNQASNALQNAHPQNATVVHAGVARTGQDKMNYVNQNFNVSATTSRNTLEVKEAPKPNKYSLKTENSESNNTNGTKPVTEHSSRMKRYGESDAERMCIFTGTVEKVIKWGKIFQNHFCYYEVIAGVVSIADGKIKFERTMLLRDKKGPILQVTYYSNSTHINIEDFHLGQMLRVVGRIIGPNIMSAITIRAASTDEVENLPRMCYVSSHAVSTMCGISMD